MFSSQSHQEGSKTRNGGKNNPIVGTVRRPLEIAESKAQHLEMGGRETEPECREVSKRLLQVSWDTYILSNWCRVDQVRAGDRHREMTGRGQAT